MSTPAANPGNILIATDSVSDAATVRKNLDEEFKHVMTSTNPRAATDDFERHQPDVLVLAFNKLEKAKSYYLGLYRLCPSIQQRPHRTIILCDKDDVKPVYELCKQRHFDDYVLYWPMAYDMLRLNLAVHQALSGPAAIKYGEPTVTQFAASARRLGGLESLLSQPSSRSDDFTQACAPHLDSVRTLSALAERVRPVLLIVDDDEFQWKILASVFNPKHYELYFAASGLDALAQLRRVHPDLILMDVRMPGMDGVEVMRRIKATRRLADIAVIMVTGQSDRQVVTESMRIGASGFVVKPFERGALLAKVVQVLNDR
ncbi:PleD family two-component system response regulator [Rhodoferax sp. PAMC 29310]|uniref:response regulator n=1 Tax=Rhodoferax sp. PAMC 29310 TaxID=2822760 RepID=UPI001B33CDB0|nr:response regulator [Rhodoferax sp. PAMC 29310]